MAIAAFVVACLSLVVAGLSAGWQIAAWKMDGRRVRVRLLHGSQGIWGSAVGPVERDHKPRDLSGLHGDGFIGDEVIGIEVTNVGRQKVRVTSYAVALKKGSMSFNPLGDAIGPTLPHWLEPGEGGTWYARRDDARALIYATRSINRQAHGIYMSATLGTGEVIKTKRWIHI